MMQQATNKTNITTFHRGIASILFLAQLLTSCGFKETLVVPSRPASESIHEFYEEPIQADCNQGFGSTDSDETFAFDTTTIAGTQLTFTHTPEAGLQATYFPRGNNTQPTPITQYPLIPTTNGIAKLFSQLTAAEAILFAREGKWEVSADGALRYLGMRGRGGMEKGIIDHAEGSTARVIDGAADGVDTSSIVRSSEAATGYTQFLGDRVDTVSGNILLLAQRTILSVAETVVSLVDSYNPYRLVRDRYEGIPRAYLNQIDEKFSVIYINMTSSTLLEEAKHNIATTLQKILTEIHETESFSPKAKLYCYNHLVKNMHVNIQRSLEAWQTELYKLVCRHICDTMGIATLNQVEHISRGIKDEVITEVTRVNAEASSSDATALRAEMQTMRAAFQQEMQTVRSECEALKQQLNTRFSAKHLLGPNNYLGAETWSKLGVQDVTEPPLSDSLLTWIYHLHISGQQPLLVLDPGKSIQDLLSMYQLYGANTPVFYKEKKADTASKLHCDDELAEELAQLGRDLAREPIYNTATDTPHWVVVPTIEKGVLPGSRGKSYVKQVRHMQSNYPGFEVGDTRTLMTVVLLKRIADGTQLFPFAPFTLARTKDLWRTNYQGDPIVIGGCSDVGLLATNVSELIQREGIGAFCFLSSRTAAEASTVVSKNDESATYIAALPPNVLKNILSYTDAATCVASYQLSKSYLDWLDLWKKACQLSKSYLEGSDLWDKALARAQLLIPKVLGNNFVSTKAWQALDVEVPTLPELSPALIKEVKRLHQERQQPLLVLDLGKSIQEIEALCKEKDITVLKADGDAEKLRAESCYSAACPASPRWLLLPGSEHGVLPGSRNLNDAQQVQHMHTCYPGYEVGGARELVTLVMLKYLQDRTVLLGGNPTTWARCKELYQTGDWKDRIVTLGNRSSSASGGLVANLRSWRMNDNFGLFGVLCVFPQPRYKKALIIKN